MSEREEVLREYGERTDGVDTEHAMADEIVRLRSQLAAAESIAQAREVLITALRGDKDEARAQLTTAERERDEARREREELQIEHADALDAYRQMYESERDRAERADAVRDAAIAFIRDLDRRIQQPLSRRSDTCSEMYFAYKHSGIGEAVRALDASGRGDAL